APAPDEERDRGEEVADLREAPLAPDKQEEEARLEKEGEEPLHRQGLTDHAARVAAELGPVRAELELHGDAGDDADREVDAEDADPEARRVVPALAAGAEAQGLHDHDQEGQPHGELGEEVVVDDGERELQAMKDERVIHPVTPPRDDGNRTPL